MFEHSGNVTPHPYHTIPSLSDSAAAGGSRLTSEQGVVVSSACEQHVGLWQQLRQQLQARVGCYAAAAGKGGSSGSGPDMMAPVAEGARRPCHETVWQLNQCFIMARRSSRVVSLQDCCDSVEHHFFFLLPRRIPSCGGTFNVGCVLGSESRPPLQRGARGAGSRAEGGLLPGLIQTLAMQARTGARVGHCNLAVGCLNLNSCNAFGCIVDDSCNYLVGRLVKKVLSHSGSSGAELPGEGCSSCAVYFGQG